MLNNTLLKELHDFGEGLLRAYATILFSNNWLIGVLFLGASFWYPNAGLAGLIGAIVGTITARMLSFPNLSEGLHIYNSLLVGLALGIVYRLDNYLIVLIIMGAVLAVILTVALTDVLWRLEHLPVLSLPFVMVAFTCFFAAQAYGNLSVYLFPSTPIDPLFGGFVDNFLVALGSAFFIPHPIAGLMFFVGLLLTSRYLALLAITGYFVGYSLLTWLTGSIHPVMGQWGGFNFILTAIAVGGIFTIPSWQSFLLAMVAAALSSVVAMAVQGVLQIYSLPVLAIPFLLTTLTVLAAMRKRQTTSPPHLLLESPSLPECSYEQARLAKSRGAEPDSVPLAAPFFGSWDIYQGFNGPHTHQPPWQHALDFIITKRGCSYRNNGTSLNDYYCFDLPVLSPCYGTVVRYQDNLPDNPPGEVDAKNNWGNFVLIYLDSGLYVLLAHLREESVTVVEGERLIPGQPLARCGNTGRSPQPHLHMHVQTTAVLGSPTQSFHLVGVTVQSDTDAAAGFYLASRPDEGDHISVLKSDGLLQHALHMPLGLQLRYRYSTDESTWTTQTLTASMDLEGHFLLTSGSGASTRYMEEGGVLYFYCRQGPKDILLDTWILSLGLSPLADATIEWQDKPSDRLIPVSYFYKVLRSVIRPLGGGLDSRYHRVKRDNTWHQTGVHQLSLLPGIVVKAESNVEIVPHRGCVHLLLKTNGIKVEVVLEEILTLEDQGIPQTEISLLS